MRWSKDEIQTIRDVFKDENFVSSVRNVMLGFTDKFEHQTTDKVLKILNKNLLPEYEIDVPLDCQQDLCELSLDYIKGFNFEEGIKRIEAYDLAVDYLQRRFDVLMGKEDTGESKDDFKDKARAKDREDRFIRLLAYLQIGRYIEKSLLELVQIAGSEELTPEELAKKQKQDSNK